MIILLWGLGFIYFCMFIIAWSYWFHVMDSLDFDCVIIEDFPALFGMLLATVWPVSWFIILFIKAAAMLVRALQSVGEILFELGSGK